MAEPKILRSPSVRDLSNVDSLYFLAFAWLFGQSVWQSFFAGILAHRALTRQTFTILQARTLPVYFAISGILSSFLLAVWTRTNWEEIHSNLTRFGNPAVRQASVLFVVSALSLANWYFIGPKTNGIVVMRQKLERAEGKPYYDPEVSKGMKDINWKFKIWHSVSALVNLVTILALLYHGMWLANFGLRNK